ncbi:MAG: 30S ribosomal protein S21 [Alphaproteobacteria bacterium]|nr:30S ribosomal protein S21 [Alphaproteobacteria bacterium]
MRVFVKDNNVDQALRFLKKKMQREGLLREMKKHTAFEKPSERKVREKAEAIRRTKKLARKKLQREGVLPMPKPKPRPERRPNPFQSGSMATAAPAERTRTPV